MTVASTQTSVGQSTVLLALVAVVVAALTHVRQWQLPDAYNPLAPLHIDEAPGWLTRYKPTRYKLARLDDAPAACLATLEEATMGFEPLADRVTGPNCGF